MDFSSVWAFVEADLKRARNALPESAASHESIRQYNEFLAHNELELACGMLEAYAEECPVNRGFWLALRDAAEKMQLSDDAARYEQLSTFCQG